MLTASFKTVHPAPTSTTCASSYNQKNPALPFGPSSYQTIWISFARINTYATQVTTAPQLRDCIAASRQCWHKKLLGKEHIVILHPIHGVGDTFRLLGCYADAKLVMNQAVDKILAQVRPKIQAILRTKPHYPTKDLIGQFKTHMRTIKKKKQRWHIPCVKPSFRKDRFMSKTLPAWTWYHWTRNLLEL